MELKDISDLLDARLKVLSSDILLSVEKLIDSKIEPVKNSLEALGVDLRAVRLHVESINNRLEKLENRMARVETKVDSIILNDHRAHEAA